MSERLEIIITATDQASGVLGRVGGALGSIGQIAGGILTAGIFTRLGQEILQMGSEALDATASWERLGMSMTSMVARELRNADSTLTMSDAMALAGDKAEGLMGWIEKLAINSPFDSEGIGTAYRQALTYGFASDEAQKLTQVLVDMSAGMGLTSSKMELISYALGQINQSDKLLMLDLRQLMNAGVPVNDILKEMGYTLADVGTASISTKDFIATFTKSMGEDFEGAAAKQSKGWAGLMNSISDIKKIGLREFFSSTFDTIQPYIGQFVDKFSDPVFKESLREWGKPLGEFAVKLMDLVPQFLEFITIAKQKIDIVSFFAAEPLQAFKDLLGLIKSDIMGLASGVELPSFGEIVKTVMGVIADSIRFVIAHWDTFKVVLIAVGAVLAGAAIVGSIVSIASAIAGLATPIGWVVAAAAFLGVAWGENWFGIQEKTGSAIAWVKELIAGGMQFINDLTSGKLGFLSGLWNSTWGLIKLEIDTALVNIKLIMGAFQAAFNGDWVRFGEMLRMVWDMAWINIGTILSTAWNSLMFIAAGLVNSIITFFTTADWRHIGTNIVEGIIAGLLAMVGEVMSATKKVADAISGTLTGFFRIKSPSGWAEDVVGKNIALGTINGWTNALNPNAFIPALANSMSGAVPAAGTYAAGIPAMAGSGSSGATPVMITLNYSPMLSTASADELQNKLTPFILKGVREARSGVGI